MHQILLADDLPAKRMLMEHLETRIANLKV